MSTSILTQQFTDAVNDCRQLYVDKAVESVVYKSDWSTQQRTDYLDEVEFRFNRLLIKVFVEVAWSDLIWSEGEGTLAKSLVEQLLRQRLKEKDVLDTLDHLFRISNAESWQAVLEPFTLLEELDEHRGELESGLMRMANIVAKIDGKVTDETLGQLKNLKWQLHQFLAPPREVEESPEKSYLSYHDLETTGTASNSDSTLTTSATTTSTRNKTQAQPKTHTETTAAEPVDQTERLQKALAELDDLVGIKSVKKEVQGLVNFLKVQTARKAAGLPENQISLHMVFEGNPGTGKTTVARILGRIFGAMGVIEKGHLVETDRSGLVAEYVGQTAAKANAIIDSALDGVLFIDEAYSLIAEDGKDSFGAEALQILLKRAEDDRSRLIVILAGYSQPMKRMLKSNPGLSSRFSRTFNFPDYSPVELSKIFQLLTDKNHYKLTADVQAKLMDQITVAAQNKDEHFGNGRLIRNLFENAIRRLADRVVDVADLTPELLTTFQVADLEVE